MFQKLDWQKVLSANADTASWAAKIARVGAPTLGTGVFDVTRADRLILMPFGTDTADQQFSMRVWGWRQVAGVADGFWTPTIIAQVKCTLCTAAGVASRVVASTELFCDYIELTNGLALLSSVPANTAAQAEFSIATYERIEVAFYIEGSAVDCNALMALYNSDQPEI